MLNFVLLICICCILFINFYVRYMDKNISMQHDDMHDHFKVNTRFKCNDCIIGKDKPRFLR